MNDIAELLGRILISFLFIYEAIDTLIFFDKTKTTLSSYHIIWRQDWVIIGLATLLLVGGILVLIGYLARFGATMLLLYWLPYTFIVYSFWDDAPSLQRIHALYFMRNLALCGGLLLLITNGAGKYSIKRLISIMRLPK